MIAHPENRELPEATIFCWELPPLSHVTLVLSLGSGG